MSRMESHKSKCIAGNKLITVPKEAVFTWKNLHMRDSVMYQAYYEFLYKMDDKGVSVPCGFSIIIIGPDQQIYAKEDYFGETPLSKFTKRVIYWSHTLHAKVSSEILPINMSEKEQLIHQKATQCSICNIEFLKNKGRKGKGRKSLHHHHALHSSVKGYYFD
jgi:hypothetical protein